MDQLVSVKKYIYKANAEFAGEALEEAGIESVIEEKEEAGTQLFEIKVKEGMEQNASAELQKLDLDETPVNDESKNYIEGLNEWLTNMYNVGYYTGGRIPSFYLDKSNWKVLIAYFILLGFVASYGWLEYGLLEGFLALVVGGGIYFFVSISMIRQIKNKKP